MKSSKLEKVELKDEDVILHLECGHHIIVKHDAPEEFYREYLRRQRRNRAVYCWVCSYRSMHSRDEQANGQEEKHNLLPAEEDSLERRKQ